MKTTRKMALWSSGSINSEIKTPLYTGEYTLTPIGNYMYLHMLSSGVLTIKSKGSYDLFCVGGGGKGGYGSYSYPDDKNKDGSYNGSTTSGAGSGYTTTLLNQTISSNTTLSVIIASGSSTYGARGGTTSIGDLISAEGGYSNPRAEKFGTGNGSGMNGGSGGGAGQHYTNKAGGAGGSDGSNGSKSQTTSKYPKYEVGGKGQGTTTRAFGESTGTLYAGGGGGPKCSGGSGGGGKGASSSSSGSTAGTVNTGGGGGSGIQRYSPAGGNGGSGIAIIRWKVVV